jgi:hypothetical protein
MTAIVFMNDFYVIIIVVMMTINSIHYFNPQSYIAKTN